jgi:hypothetical protein
MKHSTTSKNILTPGVVYVGDNGALICSLCAGHSARTTGKDISGQRVFALQGEALAETVRCFEGHPVKCSCGKTTASDGKSAPHDEATTLQVQAARDAQVLRRAKFDQIVGMLISEKDAVLVDIRERALQEAKVCDIAIDRCNAELKLLTDADPSTIKAIRASIRNARKNCVPEALADLDKSSSALDAGNVDEAKSYFMAAQAAQTHYSAKKR